MYQDIRIKHFRGFENLTIEGLSQVNVFVGRNNSGKTSILEAIFLLTNPRNGSLPFLLGHARDFKGEELKQSHIYLWYSLDYNTGIEIVSKSEVPEYTQRLRMEAVFGEVDKLEQSIALDGLNTDIGLTIPTGFRYRVGVIEGEGEQRQVQIEPSIRASYLPSQRLDANTRTNLKRIVEYGDKEKLIGFLSTFDSRVRELEFVGEELFVGLEGVSNLLPINIVGDGLRRFISVCSAIANRDNDIVLIDEVDNGIHHSSYRLLWEMILRTAKENNVQLFITTHSDESLFALAEANKRLAQGERADAAIYSVDHTKSGAKTYRYEVADYEDVREGHVDPRN